MCNCRLRPLRNVQTPLKRFVVVPEGQNGSAMLGRACSAKHGGQLEKCLIASVSVVDIQTPVFGWQSEYDLDQRGCEMTAACAASAACVNAYGRNLTAAIRTQLCVPTFEPVAPAVGPFLFFVGPTTLSAFGTPTCVPVCAARCPRGYC